MSGTNVNSQSDSNPPKNAWYKSPWVIAWLLLVVTVLAVNIFMIYQSVNDYPGLVVDDFYERGQNYEENILNKLESNKRWKTAFKLDDIHVNRKTLIGFSITDQQGKPTAVESMTLFAYRPSNAKKDFSVPMQQHDQDKTLYQANLSFNSKGKWDLLASAVIDGTEVNYAKTIFVKD